LLYVQETACLGTNIAFFSLEKDILLAKGEYERAIAVLQQAERRGVSKSRLSLGYYHAYLGLGQDEKAWLTLQPRADDIKRNPKLMADLGQIGVRLYQSGRYRSSEAAYEHILLLNPDEPRALNNLGFLLIADHQWERSESLLRKALENGFESPSITLANLAYLCMLQARYDEAIELLEDAEQKAKQDEGGILRVACWYKGAISQSHADLYPSRFAKVLLVVRANLATVLQKTGNVVAASAIADKAIGADPEDSIGYRVLGCLRLDQGDIEGARRAWEMAQQRRKTESERELVQDWLGELQVTPEARQGA
jgi:tetratricopeptide (TPR) repeat protein